MSIVSERLKDLACAAPMSSLHKDHYSCAHKHVARHMEPCGSCLAAIADGQKDNWEPDGQIMAALELGRQVGIEEAMAAIRNDSFYGMVDVERINMTVSGLLEAK